MTSWTLLLRSLRFRARSHLGVVLGSAVGSAALIGALIVGDSVRGSLRGMALARLGEIEWALDADDRLFRDQLAADLQLALARNVAPGLRMPGTAATSDGRARANRVQVLGVDARFWALAPRPPTRASSFMQGMVINQALAEQLKVSEGEEVLLRVQKPSLLSRDAPMSPQQDASSALRLAVQTVVPDEEFGRFSLQASQIPPFNAFVPLNLLQRQLGVTNQANLLLVGGDSILSRESNAVSARRDAQTPAVALPAAAAALRQHWQLADLELKLVSFTNSAALELRSRRVFLDPPIAQAALGAASNANGLLTYFVNELQVGERSTPYSMVTGMGPPVVPPDLRHDEILINDWLAEDLAAKAGDELSLSYYVVGTTRRLETRREHFRIRAVVPLSGPAADPELMPDFPGVAQAESTRDWDAGFSIEWDKIRQKDEKYWKDHRGTPKAFVTQVAAQRMWTNRFGELTAVRYPPSTGVPPPPSPSEIADSIRSHILRTVDPATVGLIFQAARAQALAASAQSQDFGQLFLGFSSFLIAAALILMGLLFQFGLEQRTGEVGTLLALGFRPRQVRRLLLLEGAALALLGGMCGTAGGLAYAHAMLRGLATIWRDAVGTSALHFHVTWATLVVGLASSVAVNALAIALVLRRQARQPARELLAEGAAGGAAEESSRGWTRARTAWIAGAAGAGALALLGWAVLSKDTASAGAFFGAGALCLIAGLSLSAGLLTALGRSAEGRALTLTSLGLRGCARRRKRSLATVALLACGSFIVVAVGANRLEVSGHPFQRASGTGGFALLGESTLPVVPDLNSKEGRDFFGLDATALAGVDIVALRVRDGDDASCLNLNRAQTPRLLGVKPELLAARGAFTVAKLAKGVAAEKPWLSLHRVSGDDAVPAIGDQASIQWAMGKKVGDTLDFLDARGRPFKVRLVGGVANSILQGNLLIAEEEFVARFPEESGYRMFFIDTPSNRVASVAAALTRALQDVGLELTPSQQRLAAFNAVQNTYLSTFQILGGLGLLLGAAGVGVVVLRNVLERRGELALCLAVGFRRRALHWLVLSEHAGLLWLGLGVGMVAALVAILPALLAPGARIHYFALGVMLGGVCASGLAWTWWATWLTLRGKLIEGLRNE